MEKTNLRFQQMVIEEDGRLTSPIEVGVGDVHVHGFSLDIDKTKLGRAASVLSAEERTRADRLVSELHRVQFVVAHAGLRVILSRYCAGLPHELAIQKGAKGKPFLSEYPSIRFNMTHSQGKALIVVAKNREVGVDLEKVRLEVDVLSLARRFLSDRDITFIESGEPGQRHQRFLQAWVAREAVFKAAGTGVTFPLHCDHIELAGDGTEGHLILGDGKSDGAVRSVRFLPLDSGWVGAVSAEGNNWSVVCCNVG
jgi:4'-phosphopantetheinyl transferase